MASKTPSPTQGYSKPSSPAKSSWGRSSASSVSSHSRGSSSSKALSQFNSQDVTSWSTGSSAAVETEAILIPRWYELSGEVIFTSSEDEIEFLLEAAVLTAVEVITTTAEVVPVPVSVPSFSGLETEEIPTTTEVPVIPTSVPEFKDLDTEEDTQPVEPQVDTSTVPEFTDLTPADETSTADEPSVTPTAVPIFTDLTSVEETVEEDTTLTPTGTTIPVFTDLTGVEETVQPADPVIDVYVDVLDLTSTEVTITPEEPVVTPVTVLDYNDLTDAEKATDPAEVPVTPDIVPEFNDLDTDETAQPAELDADIDIAIIDLDIHTGRPIAQDPDVTPTVTKEFEGLVTEETVTPAEPLVDSSETSGFQPLSDEVVVDSEEPTVTGVTVPEFKDLDTEEIVTVTEPDIIANVIVPIDLDAEETITPVEPAEAVAVVPDGFVDIAVDEEIAPEEPVVDGEVTSYSPLDAEAQTTPGEPAVSGDHEIGPIAQLDPSDVGIPIASGEIVPTPSSVPDGFVDISVSEDVVVGPEDVAVPVVPSIVTPEFKDLDADKEETAGEPLVEGEVTSHTPLVAEETVSAEDPDVVPPVDDSFTDLNDQEVTVVTDEFIPDGPDPGEDVPSGWHVDIRTVIPLVPAEVIDLIIDDFPVGPIVEGFNERDIDVTGEIEEEGGEPDHQQIRENKGPVDVTGSIEEDKYIAHISVIEEVEGIDVTGSIAEDKYTAHISIRANEIVDVTGSIEEDAEPDNIPAQEERTVDVTGSIVEAADEVHTAVRTVTVEGSATDATAFVPAEAEHIPIRHNVGPVYITGGPLEIARALHDATEFVEVNVRIQYILDSAKVEDHIATAIIAWIPVNNDQSTQAVITEGLEGNVEITYEP